MIEIVGTIGRVATKQEISDFVNGQEKRRPEITYELARMARNVVIQYAENQGDFDCIDCAYYATCHEDFASCPARWRR